MPLCKKVPAVAVRDMGFAYPGLDPVLHIDNLTVGAGERVFLHGPSGCGKTTLLGIITGILTPQTGSVAILGRHLEDMAPAERDTFRGGHIGYIFQLFNLIGYLTVAQNIALPCLMNETRAAALGDVPLDQAVASATAALDIESLLDSPVSRLSVGQQQRVAAARAVMGSPGLVVADEPTSALDQANRERFLTLLFERCAAVGAAVVVASHDLALAGHFDRTVAIGEVNRPL